MQTLLSLTRYESTELEYDADSITPEKSLIVAVIERAIFDYVGSHSEERREARSWLFDGRRDIFSFHWCLDELNLLGHKKYFRERILLLPTRGGPRKQQHRIKNGKGAFRLKKIRRRTSTLSSQLRVAA